MITIIPDETTLINAARQAAASHLHLITNGRRTVLSPVIPDGWTPIYVTFKGPANAQS